MKIGILGSGSVAQTLAAGFAAHGHAVMLGTREPAKLAGWAAAHPAVQVKNCDLAIAHGTGGLLGVRHAASTCILERV